MNFQPEQLTELASKMEKPLEEWLKWREMLDRLERGKNTVFSKCFLRALAGTVRERECIAYADEDYVKYLDEVHNAAKKAIAARVAYENMKNQFDAVQSGMAFIRDSMRRLG